MLYRYKENAPPTSKKQPIKQRLSRDSLFDAETYFSLHNKSTQDSITSFPKSLSRKGSRQLQEIKQNQISNSFIVNDSDIYHKHSLLKDDEPVKIKKSRLSDSFDLPKRSLDKKKEKSIEPRKSLQLQKRIDSLKDLIRDEEIMLLGLQKKVYSEKTELSTLLQKADGRPPKPKMKSRQSSKNFRLNKSSVGRSHTEMAYDSCDTLDTTYMEERQKTEESIPKRRGSLKAESEKCLDKSNNSFYKRSRSIAGLQKKLDTKESFRKTSYRESEEEKEEYKKRMNMIEGSIKELMGKYDDEISELKNQVRNLRSENMTLKDVVANGKMAEKAQVLHSKRLKEVAESLRRKEKELTTREKYYTEQFDNIGKKVIGLNEELKGLKSVGEKERKREVKPIKDWSNVQSELFSQLKVLQEKAAQIPSARRPADSKGKIKKLVEGEKEKKNCKSNGKNYFKGFYDLKEIKRKLMAN